MEMVRPYLRKVEQQLVNSRKQWKLVRSVRTGVLSIVNLCGSYLGIGINVPIPVPLPMFSWSGNKASVLGGHSLYGDLGLDFWLQNKVSHFLERSCRARLRPTNQTITSYWKADDALQSKADVAMPTHR